MKKVLYISNIEVPYRVKFFNELAKKCELTVLYERKKSNNRNSDWTKSVSCNHTVFFLSGVKIKNENSFDLKILTYVLSCKYDFIVFGCYNSPIQMFTMLLLKFLKKDYYLNFDGEVFVGNKGIKNNIKKFFIKGAKKYIVAGEKSVQSIKDITKSNNVYPYYFSSLTIEEIIKNKKRAMENNKRENYILVVGQYYEYKGLDVLLEVAKLEPNIFFKIIGTGNRTNLILNKINKMNLKNVDVIDFLNTEQLEEEFLKCYMLVLPSKQECWGLVINEAASFGTPIVSTYGSGAAVEFLENEYSQFLANPNDVEDLDRKIKNLINYKETSKYVNYLLEKNNSYNIENSVYMYMQMFNK